MANPGLNPVPGQVMDALLGGKSRAASRAPVPSREAEQVGQAEEAFVAPAKAREMQAQEHPNPTMPAPAHLSAHLPESYAHKRNPQPLAPVVVPDSLVAVQAYVMWEEAGRPQASSGLSVHHSCAVRASCSPTSQL
jgi:hypothetical protein